MCHSVSELNEIGKFKFWSRWLTKIISRLLHITNFKENKPKNKQEKGYKFADVIQKMFF